MIIKRKDNGEIIENVKLGKGSTESFFAYDGSGVLGAVCRLEQAEIYFSEEELQERIEAAVEEYKDTQVYPMQSLQDESIKLKNRIAELEAERQPVEVSEGLAEAIERYKSPEGFEDAWKEAFVMGWNKSETLAFDGNHPSKRFIAFEQTNVMQRVKIVQNGYTIKPDPLRTLISEVFAEYTENEDMTEAQLLDELTTAVKHYVQSSS